VTPPGPSGLDHPVFLSFRYPHWRRRRFRIIVGLGITLVVAVLILEHMGATQAMPIDAAGDFRDGLATTMWLRSIGFTNIRDVARIGVIETCTLLRRAGHPVSLNLAYGLQADLMGTTWNRLPAEVKTAARAAYRERFG
jgi:hypothetical protein